MAACLHSSLLQVDWEVGELLVLSGTDYAGTRVLLVVWLSSHLVFVEYARFA
jgi:hypothetical protein